jgi:AraC-like DNA-binding protein
MESLQFLFRRSVQDLVDIHVVRLAHGKRNHPRKEVGENLDATSAGFKVGYNDASYFSRDYKKHFGNAPARDVERLRAGIGG